MDLLKVLLDNYIIVKETDSDLYYDIKDNLKSFKTFIQDKLGYDIVINSDFIKIEKFPGRVEGWMGIECFEDVKDYCLFSLLIMFLEDRGKEEQFVLSQLVEYINVNFEEEKLDWTTYSNRRALVRVLRFAIDLKIIKIDDGDENSFTENENAEVLYENTGISKYVIRSFPSDITDSKSYKDFINFAWNDIDTDRGNLRRNRVYRTLTMSPVLYNEGSDDSDFYYVRNYKASIENDFEKYLNWKIHFHKDAALVVLSENERCKDYFPYNNAVSDIVLSFNKLILNKVKEKELNIDENSNIEVEKKYFKEMVNELKCKKSIGWSKEYREMSDNNLYENILKYMKDYNMVSEHNETCTILPLVGKVIGDYPEDFNERSEKQ